MNKEKWEIKKLGEVCEIVSGSTPKTNVPEFWEGGDLKWITPAEITNKSVYVFDTERHITQRAVQNTNLKPFPKDTVILSSRAPIGKVAIAGSEMFCNQGFKNLVCNNEFIKPLFLFYFLKNNTEYLNSLGRGATFKEISKQIVSNIQINLPPLPTQEKIVSELDTLHRLKELQEQQLTEFDNLAQSTFYSLFGDPIDNEKGWEVRKLGEVCEITSSKRIFAEEYQEIGVPFYRSKEVIEKSKKLSISLELFISEERYLEVKTAFGVPKIGDILMTAVGTIGEVWVVDTIEPFYFKDGNIVWLKMNNSHNSFFFEFALNKLVNEYKKKMSIGSAYSALTIINLKNMQVIIPPLSLQTAFAERIEKIEAQKELVKRSIGETQTLIDYTMDKYFG